MVYSYEKWWVIGDKTHITEMVLLHTAYKSLGGGRDMVKYKYYESAYTLQAPLGARQER